MLALPTNIEHEINGNSVIIKFIKGTDSVRTEIDKFWVGDPGQGTYDESTLGSTFTINNLEWGTTYQYKLRVFSSSGERLETDILSFNIEPAIMPVLPDNVNVNLELTTALIRFNKGAGTDRVYIDKFWVGEESSYDEYTKGNAFYYENLSLETTYQYKLKAVSTTGHFVESEVYSFATEPIVLAQLPTDVEVAFDEAKRNVATVKFTKNGGVKTEIDKFWVNGQNTWDNYTSGSLFNLGELVWGTEYEFKLKSIGNTGDYLVTDVFKFKIDDAIIPTKPTNIEVIIDEAVHNAVTINFTKGNGIRTYIEFIDKNHKVLDTYTTGEAFHFENLAFNTTYSYVLRTLSNTGESVSTEVSSFSIDPVIVATPPTNIEVIIDEAKRNSVMIRFTKGQCIRTEIEKLWIKDKPQEFDEYTLGQVFYYNDLKFGERYEFILRSVGTLGDVATTEMISFNIENEMVPTAPSDVNVKVFKNNAEITFKKWNAVKTFIDKTWIGEPNSYDEYTTGEIFYANNLEYGRNYTFRLKSVGNTGLTAESNLYTISVPVHHELTPPTNITVELEKDKAYIKFIKGNGVSTKLDKFWVDGEGTWEEESTDNGFVLYELSYNTEYKFVLGTVGANGDIIKSDVITFSTPQVVQPTVPTNITVNVQADNVTIKFIKGYSVRTELYMYNKGGIDLWQQHTTSQGFYITGLDFDTAYEFTLTSIGETGATAISHLCSFKTGSKYVEGGGEDVEGGNGGNGTPPPPPTTSINNYECEFEERWFYSTNSNGQPVGVTAETVAKLKEYNGYYCGDISKKVLYITTDEGYETGQTAKILDVLRENDVKIAFFITVNYIKAHPELVKRMAIEGHLVCNHSATHPSMANKARESKDAFIKEIRDCENAYRELTGKELDKFFRPPMGKFSELSLKYAKELGYKTMFWSFGYSDWNPDDQPDEAWAKEYIINHVHNGCILLLHAVSSANANILDSLIKELKKKGYLFGHLYNITNDLSSNIGTNIITGVSCNALDIQEATDWAKKFLEVANVDYSKYDLPLANANNNKLRSLLKLYPIVPKMIKNLGSYQTLYEQATSEGIELDPIAENTVAVAWGNINKRLKYEKYVGIYFNDNHSCNAETMLKNNKYSVANQWHPIGTDVLESTVTHEFGHCIHYLLIMNKADGFINEIYEKCKKKGYNYIKENLSEYAIVGDSVKEFFAEAFSEIYTTNNSVPREIAAEILKGLRESKIKEMF